MKRIKKFENFSMHREKCDRCKGSTDGTTTMSVFNTDVICQKCKEDEKKDPEYKLAQDAEAEAVRNGDRNYPGLFPNYKPLKRN